jgi:AAA family ATP:ADP antiporter
VASDDARSPVEKALGIVTRVEAGEGTSALLLTLNVFALMTGYSAIKPVREGLILAMAGGAEYKSYMGAAIAVALLVAVPAYARFADKVARNRLVVGVTLFFASHLVLFWLGSAYPPLRDRMGLIFYVWIGVFNMMVVAQFWAFANDVYKEEQGTRLFALLGVGQTVGAVAGSLLAVLLIKVIGVYGLLLVSAALLGLCAFLTQVVHLRELRAPGETKKPAAEGKRSGGAFGLVFKNDYLRYVAAFAIVFTFVNSNGEYMVGKLVKAAAAAMVAAGTLTKEGATDYMGEAFGRYYLFVNIVTVTLQTFLVSRLVRKAGFRAAFLVLPAIALIDAIGVSALPVLAILYVGKIAENGTDYSLNNTLRNMLWLPTTRELKYKAKQAIDTFFVRMGDVSSAILVYVVADRFKMGVRVFAFVNLGLCVIWILLARRIAGGFERLSSTSSAKA